MKVFLRSLILFISVVVLFALGMAVALIATGAEVISPIGPLLVALFLGLPVGLKLTLEKPIAKVLKTTLFLAIYILIFMYLQVGIVHALPEFGEWLGRTRTLIPFSALWLYLGILSGFYFLTQTRLSRNLL